MQHYLKHDYVFTRSGLCNIVRLLLFSSIWLCFWNNFKVLMFYSCLDSYLMLFAFIVCCSEHGLAEPEKKKARMCSKTTKPMMHYSLKQKIMCKDICRVKLSKLLRKN